MERLVLEMTKKDLKAGFSRAILLGSVMTLAIGIVPFSTSLAAVAQGNEQKKAGETFTNWVDESSLRAAVSSDTKAKEVVVNDGVSPTAIEANASVFSSLAVDVNDEFTANLAEETLDMIKAGVVMAPQILGSSEVSDSKVLYSPDISSVSQDVAEKVSSAPKYGKKVSPWKEKGIELSAEEMAFVEGDMSAYLAASDENATIDTATIAMNPNYGKTVGNTKENTVNVLQISSALSSALEAEGWNDRQEASGWGIKEAKAADPTVEKFLSPSTTEQETLDWLVGTNAPVSESAGTSNSALASESAVESKGGVTATVVAPVSTAPSLSAPPAPLVAEETIALPVLVPEPLYPEPLLQKTDNLPVVPQKPLLVPMDNGYSAESFGFYDNGNSISAFGEDSSQFYYDANANANNVPRSSGFAPNAPATTQQAGILDRLKQWFVGDGDKATSGVAPVAVGMPPVIPAESVKEPDSSKSLLDSVLSRYVKKTAPQISSVSRSTPSLDVVKIEFERGSPEMSASTVKWLKEFAALYAKNSYKTLEIVLGNERKALQAKRFALIKSILLSNGFTPDRIKPVFVNRNADTVLIKTSSLANEDGNVVVINAMDDGL